MLNNKQQKIDGVVLSPMEVFQPIGTLEVSCLYTENTHAAHHSVQSWEKDTVINDFVKFRIDAFNNYIQREGLQKLE